MAAGSRRANGEGSVWQEGTRWRGHARIDGRRRYVRGRTRKEVVAKIHQLQAAGGTAQQGGGDKPEERPAGNPPAVGEYLAAWLKRHATRIRPSTYTSYERLIRLHVDPTLGKRPITLVRFSEIESLILGLIDKGLSRSTAAQVRTILVQAFDSAYRDELITTNPARGVRLPKADPQKASIIPPHHRDALLEAARRRGASEFARRRLALLLGLRQSEILGLAWEDINCTDGTLRVQASMALARGGTVRDQPKTRNAIRTLNLSQDMLQALDDARREQQGQHDVYRSAGATHDDFNPEGLVFVTKSGRPIDPNNDHKAWNLTRRKAAEMLGEEIPPYRLHDGRHTVASGLIASGVDPVAVSRFLGHATAAFTLTTYVHRRADDISDAEGILLGNEPPPKLSLLI